MKTRICFSSLIALLWFFQLSAQNVGIGTPLPDYTLDVNGDAGINDYIYHNDDPGDDTFIGFSGNDSLVFQLGGKTILQGDGVEGKMIINGLGESVDFSILSDSFEHLFYADPVNRFIGIGTDSPQHLLDIAGDVRILSDSFEHLFYVDALSGYVGIGTAAPGYVLDVDGDFRVISDGIEHLFFADATNNKIGIGTSTPQYLLDVAGVINADELHLGGTPAFKKMQSGAYPQGAQFSGQVAQSYFIFFPDTFTNTPNFVASYRTNPLTPDAIVNITVKGVTTSFAEILVYRIDSPDITQGGIINWIAWE